MTEALILHQYEGSPFSEKIRRILAFKRLNWTSVRAPAVMPKPDLIALTGGYRKIPVLQIGNHVYCDSSLIARVIEERAPQPTLYPTPMAAALAEWADVHVFASAVPWILKPTRFEDLLRWMTQDELARIGDDRRAMRKDAVRSAASGDMLRVQFGIYLARLESTLQTSQYLLGSSPCIADFSVYHALWQLTHTSPEPLAPFAQVRAFVARLESGLPDREITPISSGEALERCKNSDPNWQPSAAFADPAGLAPGQQVIVRAGDYGRDPITGALAWAGLDEVVLRREDERAGTVFVHFPRLGFEITAAS